MLFDVLLDFFQFTEHTHLASAFRLNANNSFLKIRFGLADKKAAIFGPDLAGVTKRLKPGEFADSIVYPSKQVAERFRNTMVVTSDGDVYTGVLTERNDRQVVVVDGENKVHRVAASEVEEVKALETSPMPEKLLNRFTDKDIRDLVSFLRSLQ